MDIILLLELGKAVWLIIEIIIDFKHRQTKKAIIADLTNLDNRLRTLESKVKSLSD